MRRIILGVVFGSLLMAQEPVFKEVVTAVTPNREMKAFWPVPKGGCPKGFYEVGHTFNSGEDWYASCWNEKLNRLVVDKKELKLRKVIARERDGIQERNKGVDRPIPKAERQ